MPWAFHRMAANSIGDIRVTRLLPTVQGPSNIVLIWRSSLACLGARQTAPACERWSA
jgi:hypothetical protein